MQMDDEICVKLCYFNRNSSHNERRKKMRMKPLFDSLVKKQYIYKKKHTILYTT